jgi:glycosyltransferase involved in cell wall biosynthesis
MKSLLFDARLVLSKPTGIGQYIASLLPEIVIQAPELHIHLLRRPDPWPDYGIEGWQAPTLTHHISRLPHMSLRQHLYLPRFAKQLGVDLIHYPHFDAPVFNGSVPVVATLHDAKYLVRPGFFTHLNTVKRASMRFAFRATLKRAKHVISDSLATAEDIHRLFGVSTDRMTVVYLAAHSRFRPVTASAVDDLRRRYSLKRPFILTVGERRPHKNHIGLIEAYARSEGRATHDLVIVGQAYGDYTEPEERVRALGLAGTVHFVTSATLDDLVSFYSAAHVFALVSFYEGFGLPILEAMACGTPVIASCTTATGEISGPHSLQVDPANISQISAALNRILRDEPLRREMAAQGERWAASFSWQRAARETLAVYDRAMT